LIDSIPVDRVKEWQAAFLRAYHTQFSAVADDIQATRTVTDEQEQKLRNAITTFNESFR
jgi:F0F1-type ATP synthase alpha subunit